MKTFNVTPYSVYLATIIICNRKMYLKWNTFNRPWWYQLLLLPVNYIFFKLHPDISFVKPNAFFKCYSLNIKYVDISSYRLFKNAIFIWISHFSSVCFFPSSLLAFSVFLLTNQAAHLVSSMPVHKMHGLWMTLEVGNGMVIDQGNCPMSIKQGSLCFFALSVSLSNALWSMWQFLNYRLH